MNHTHLTLAILLLCVICALLFNFSPGRARLSRALTSAFCLSFIILHLSFYISHLKRLLLPWRYVSQEEQQQLTTSAPTATLKGITTMAWGTAPGITGGSGGTAVAVIVASTVLESVKITPHNSGPVQELENGDGATIMEAYLSDGFEADVEIAYDTALTYPLIAATVVVTLPGALSGAKGLPDVGIGAQSVVPLAFNCRLASYGVSFTRKQVAMISVKLIYRPGVST